jgi:hypothetical protein
MLTKITPEDKPREGYMNVCGNLDVDLFAEVDGTGNIDNGLGFGQGSTAGVLNRKMPCSGFQRIEMKPSSCEQRKKFNLHRLCCSAYSTHYDNSTICPDDDSDDSIKLVREQTMVQLEEKPNRSLLVVFGVCFVLILLAMKK